MSPPLLRSKVCRSRKSNNELFKSLKSPRDLTSSSASSPFDALEPRARPRPSSRQRHQAPLGSRASSRLLPGVHSAEALHLSSSSWVSRGATGLFSRPGGGMPAGVLPREKQPQPQRPAVSMTPQAIQQRLIVANQELARHNGKVRPFPARLKYTAVLKPPPFFAASRGSLRVTAPRGHGRQRREAGRDRQRDPPAAERQRRPRDQANPGTNPTARPTIRPVQPRVQITPPSFLPPPAGEAQLVERRDHEAQDPTRRARPRA